MGDRSYRYIPGFVTTNTLSCNVDLRAAAVSLVQLKWKVYLIDVHISNSDVVDEAAIFERSNDEIQEKFSHLTFRRRRQLEEYRPLQQSMT